MSSPSGPPINPFPKPQPIPAAQREDGLYTLEEVEKLHQAAFDYGVEVGRRRATE